MAAVIDFRGLAHKDCKINFSQKNKPIPIIIHIFKGYDSKQIMTKISNSQFKYVNVDIIMENNSEKFKTVSLRDKKKSREGFVPTELVSS